MIIWLCGGVGDGDNGGCVVMVVLVVIEVFVGGAGAVVGDAGGGIGCYFGCRRNGSCGHCAGGCFCGGGDYVVVNCTGGVNGDAVGEDCGGSGSDD